MQTITNTPKIFIKEVINSKNVLTLILARVKENDIITDNREFPIGKTPKNVYGIPSVAP